MNYAFAENSFSLSDNPSKHGLFLIHSRFNHSCIPNCNVPSTKGEIIASSATRDIVGGEEITFVTRQISSAVPEVTDIKYCSS
ncbi:hypothetical protein BGZ57DRAFT_879977 [Hyaloscypha finlandica]|nr:hypothetical protein BGZ57DRAFT_879977 [Hyaloscypha finlandica]